MEHFAFPEIHQFRNTIKTEEGQAVVDGEGGVMGMFDNVKCDYPLPGVKPKDPGVLNWLQTKDLDCLLWDYTIDSYGWLRDPKGEKVNWTGELEFYGGNFVDPRIRDYPDGVPDNEWVVYVATFAGGLLMDIEQTRYECIPARPLREL